MSVSDCLLIKLYIELVYGHNGYFYCLVPRRLSVSMKIYAQRKAGEENGRGRRLCLSSFSIPWSIALRQQSLAFSRSPLCKKRSVWGEKEVIFIFLVIYFLLYFNLPWVARAMKTPHRSMNEWALPSGQRSPARSREECKFCDHCFYLILDTLWKK